MSLQREGPQSVHVDSVHGKDGKIMPYGRNLFCTAEETLKCQQTMGFMVSKLRERDFAPIRSMFSGSGILGD